MDENDLKKWKIEIPDWNTLDAPFSCQGRISKLINNLKKTQHALIDGKRKHVLQKQTTITKSLFMNICLILGFQTL